MFTKGLIGIAALLWCSAFCHAQTVTYGTFGSTHNTITIADNSTGTTVYFWGTKNSVEFEIDGVGYTHSWSNGRELRVYFHGNGGSDAFYYLNLNDFSASVQPEFYYYGSSGIDVGSLGKRNDYVSPGNGYNNFALYDGTDVYLGGTGTDTCNTGPAADIANDAGGSNDSVSQGSPLYPNSGELDYLGQGWETITDPAP